MHEFLERDAYKESQNLPKTPEYVEAVQAKTDELRQKWIATLSEEDQIKYNALEKEIIPLLWKYKIPYIMHAWIATKNVDGLDNPIQYHTLSEHEAYTKEYIIDYSARITGSFFAAASLLTHMDSGLNVYYNNSRSSHNIMIKNGKLHNL